MECGDGHSVSVLCRHLDFATASGEAIGDDAGCF